MSSLWPRDVKIANFTKALVKFVASGRGFLPQEEVNKRFEICKSCDHFTGTKCRICGCGTSDRQGSLLNKLALPTEACPAKPPKWKDVRNH